MLIKDIVCPNYGRDGIRALLVGKIQEEQYVELALECARIADEEAGSDVGREGHVTNWTNPVGVVRQWSLLNTDGRFNSTACDTKTRGEEKRLPRAGIYPGLWDFIKSWPEAHNMRLNLIGPHSRLGDHKEQTVVIDEGQVRIKARFHLPIQTNAGAIVNLDGESYSFAAGNVYFFNNACTHSSVNNGDSNRLHLVWDCFVNARVKKLLDASLQISPCGKWDAGPAPCEAVSVTESEAMRAAEMI